MAPIVVSSFFPAAAPRLLLRMATPQPIAQHEHARVRFVQRHEVPFCARGCWVFFLLLKKKNDYSRSSAPKATALCLLNYAVTKKNRVARARLSLGPTASALLPIGAP